MTVKPDCKRGWLFVDHTIHLDASIRADERTALAPDALLGLSHVGKMVTSIVDFFLLKGKHIARTCHYAKVTPLAALFVDNYCSLYFHYYV